MRKKITRPSYITWDALPCVQLSKKIAQEKWAINSTITLSYDQVQWEQVTTNGSDNTFYDPHLNIDIPYQNKTIQLHVSWTTRNRAGTLLNKFNIELDNYKIIPHNRQKGRILKTSKTLEGTIQKIEDIILFVIPSIDEIIVEEKEKEKEEKQIDQQAKELSENIGGVTLTRIYGHHYKYKPSPSYGMEITIPRKGNLYEIRNLEGGYTLDELHQILKIVGTNPRAIVERLSR